MFVNKINYLQSLAPYPSDIEIGVEFFHNNPKLVEGDEDHVMINTLCDGFFHTHPIDALPQFSDLDLDLILGEDMKFAYLGWGEHLYELKITPKLHKAYRKYKNFPSAIYGKQLERLTNKLTIEIF